MTHFRLGELFCGPGGLACGALAAASDDGRYAVSHAWATDYDPDSCATYVRNICPDSPGSVICRDVRSLDIDALTPIDAFAYGFPCNSFSKVGERQGLANEKFGMLYWYGVLVLRKFQPKWFVAENVTSLRSTGDNGFHRILRDLRESGYRLTVHHYWAEDYGVPQRRHRIIIVGLRDDLGLEYRVPDPAMFAHIDITARTALHDIPSWAQNNEIHKNSVKIIERLGYIAPGENVWQAEARLPERLRIKTRTKISQIYRKLHPDFPSYTITASGGGGTFGYHWDNRELTNRERARLQTFPDSYGFVGKYASVRRQIGMAVPCALSRVIVTAILNTFAGIPYRSIPPNISVS